MIPGVTSGQSRTAGGALAITSGAAFSVDENTSLVGVMTATRTAVWSITGGDDAALFTITSGGSLSFLSAPDYEAPADMDTDNAYEVEVTATRGAEVVSQMLAVTVDDVAEYLLESVTPIACFSLSRDLRSAFVGNSEYLVTGGTAITRLVNQMLNANRDLTDQSQSTRRPTLVTAGPNSRAAADFDGTSDILMPHNALMSSYLNTTGGWVVCSVILDTITKANAAASDNHTIWACDQNNVGLWVKDQSPDIAQAVNEDSGGYDEANATVVAGQVHVLSWRHESNVLYLSVDGGAEVPVASGTTAGTFSANLVVGGNYDPTAGGGFGDWVGDCDMKLFEMAFFTAANIPSAPDRAAIIADMLSWAG